jgi:hypothetical protein
MRCLTWMIFLPAHEANCPIILLVHRGNYPFFYWEFKMKLPSINSFNCWLHKPET